MKERLSRRIGWSKQTCESNKLQQWLLTHPIHWDKMEGLLPTIIQDQLSKQVLMQGFMNREALKRSLESGKVTFYSRSRQKLWCKGETSGNFLHICELALDCDCDSLLIQALPSGPTCHNGSNSCYSFPAPEANQELQQLGADFGLSKAQSRETLGPGWLGALERIISQRRLAQTESPSYVQYLFKSGLQRMAQKVGEEGVELALAAMVLGQQPDPGPSSLQSHVETNSQSHKQTSKARDDLAGEAGDLLFHLLVLLQACGMRLQDVIDILEQRHRRSIERSQQNSPKPPR